MTKNEKIAITASSLVGFVLFCVTIFWIAIPLYMALGYMFSDSLRATSVEYDDLAYAMGEDFVFVSEDIFGSGYQLEESPYVEYYGRSSRFSKSSPIKGARRYTCTLNKYYGYGYSYRIRITCQKLQDDENFYDYSHGNATYRVYGYNEGEILDKDSAGYLSDITFFGKVSLTNGVQNSFNAVFSFASNHTGFKTFSYNDQLDCQKMYEYLLDNIVDYSYFADYYIF